MDFLPYDLVDHLAHFLPEADLQTIAKITGNQPELENWNLVAHEHLEQRFVLDVNVYIEVCREKHEEKKEEEEERAKRIKNWWRSRARGRRKEENKMPKIRFFIEKWLPGGGTEWWDFKNRRYASLRCVRVHVQADFEELPCNVNLYRATNLESVLRIISLPVDRSAIPEGFLFVHLHQLDDPEMSVASKMLHAVQKTFAEVNIHITRSLNSGVEDPTIEDFLYDCFNEGVFLEEMDVYCCDIRKRKVIGAIASLFGKKRTRPLKVIISEFGSHEIERFIESWVKSEGHNGEKEVIWKESDRSWEQLRRKYRLRANRLTLPHPTKRSSLHISPTGIRSETHI
ncbi:hypothetical protein QR680_015375 [Steinernema hermaphroditum]|uniref:Uncharacterized protein n=1 Tax=Steinernema hermaphroditum TaxID=289476 RepID=A0AA39H9N8_9BILA|nr:hypothetical protein QR680_015375 [Steinernema hermaphroditum]